MKVHAVSASAHRDRWAKNSIRAIAISACVVGLALLPSCNKKTPTTPGTTTTTAAGTTTTTAAATTTTTAAATTTTTAGATTTTTAEPTTTTTAPGTTTTTTTTTTTAGGIDYSSQVHPLWSDPAADCTVCHDGGNPLDLSGASPADTCTSLANRDATNGALIITGGGEAGSQILTKPSGVSHAGGSFPCFAGGGSACWDTVLTWLEQGANGPAGPCGG